MQRNVKGWALCIVAIAVSAVAQTTVTTTGGTANIVPVFTGSSTVGNSPIAVSGSSVGIGTTAPTEKLSLSGGNIYLGSSGKVESEQVSSNGEYFELQPTGWGQGAELLVNGVYSGSGEPWTNSTYRSNAGAYSTGAGIVRFDANAQTWKIGVARTSTGAGSAITWNQVSNLSAGSVWFSPRGTIGDFYMNSSGNVGIGTTAPAYTLDVAGQIHSSTGGYVFPDGTTQTTAFIPANCGADYAEAVDVTGDRTKYEPGDLLVIDPDTPGKFLKSNQPYSTMVAGIYSTKPGFVGRLQPATEETKAIEVPMAMVGRVPTMVSAENGPIKIGDLLVTSSTMGYAMKGTDRSQMMGAVVGKALGSLDSGTGVIMVLVTLQ
jgi:hypothetical protein